jgi:hypothetical protein
MRRPRQHEIETESRHLLERLLPSSWIIRPLAPDYGVDFEIELVDQQEVTGNRVWVQLKGRHRSNFATQTFRPPELGDAEPLLVQYTPYVLETKYLRYALRCAFPLLLFVADLQQADIYWLPLRDVVEGDLNVRSPDWRLQQSVSLRLPTWNSLLLEQQADYFQLRRYALEPARMNAFFTLSERYRQLEQTGMFTPGVFIPDLTRWDATEVRMWVEALGQVSPLLLSALQMEALFGADGLPIYRLPFRTLGSPSFPEFRAYLEYVIARSREVRSLLQQGELSPDIPHLLMEISSAVQHVMRSLHWYTEFRYISLLTETAAVLRQI